MARKDPLETYRGKRDFAQTPEPQGGGGERTTGSSAGGPAGRLKPATKPPRQAVRKAAKPKPTPRRKKAPTRARHADISETTRLRRHRVFVVQLHSARRLHYDFRLEIDGVLKSWAIPKGPSINPRNKHLAVMTEDHPLEYAAFEGVIPEGNYGAGEVIVWDGGVYENIKLDRDGNEVPMDQACEDGHVTVRLYGKKLQGAFAITRTRVAGGRENWIFVKMRDEFASEDVEPIHDQPESILSGRTIEDLASEARRDERAVPRWNSQAA